MASLLTSLTSLVHGTAKEPSPSDEVATTAKEASAVKSQEGAAEAPQLPKADSPPNAPTATPSAPAQALSLSKPEEERVQTLGLEDPSDPRTVDDPEIFSHKERIPLPAPGSAPVKTLVESQGQPYIDPKVYGGSMLDKVGNGLGEPLNVIGECLEIRWWWQVNSIWMRGFPSVGLDTTASLSSNQIWWFVTHVCHKRPGLLSVSSLSSPELLTKKGVQTYLRSLDFDFECLGLHGGGYQQAYVDPRGYLDQNFIFREIYTPFDHVFGTCIESLIGGNHVRAWQQQGTGAWFFAISKEQNISTHHSLVENGYDVGRDLFVQQSQKEKNGVTSFIGKKYQTKLEWVDNLLAAGTTGVNHNIPTDGRTAVLTVTRLDGKAKAIYSTQLKEQKSEARQQKKAEKKQSKEEKKLKRQSVPASGVSTSEEVASPKKKWYKRISMAA